VAQQTAGGDDAGFPRFHPVEEHFPAAGGGLHHLDGAFQEQGKALAGLALSENLGPGGEVEQGFRTQGLIQQGGGQSRQGRVEGLDLGPIRGAHSVISASTGAWSEGRSRLRGALSTREAVQWAARGAESRMWSMRRPWFFWKPNMR